MYFILIAKEKSIKKILAHNVVLTTGGYASDNSSSSLLEVFKDGAILIKEILGTCFN